MIILVTGGAGYVASNLIKQLVKNKDNTIISVDNYFTGTKDNHIPNVRYYNINTYDLDKFEWSIESIGIPDIVYHFGEYSRVRPSFKDIVYLFKSNVGGTVKVLELCRKWNAKIIYSASSSKFGGAENLSPYSSAKANMVQLIKNYNDWFGLKYEIVYFYNVYGKNHIQDGDYATVIGIFEKRYKEQLPLCVFGDGKQSRHFTHIDDIVDGLLLITEHNKNKEWYLSADESYSVLDVAKMFSPDNIEMIPAVQGERYDSVQVENDTKKVLNWKAKRKLKEYINEQK